MADGLKALSEISGQSRAKVNEIWEGVKRNQAILAKCGRHQFGQVAYKPGMRVQCLNCRGEMSLTDASRYKDGYGAAGGDPQDIYTLVARAK